MINLLKDRLVRALLVSLSAVYKLQYHILFMIVFVGIGIPLHSLSEEYVEEDIIVEELVSEPQSASQNPTPVVKTYSKGQPKVVIYNNHKVDQTSAQAPNISTQPVVRVTGTPITKVPAVELRQSRQEAELMTEQKIVEKLESSRLRDEQERLNKLFPSESAKTVVANGAAIAPVDISAQAQAPSIVHNNRDSLYLGFHGGQAFNVVQQVENLESYGSFGVSAGSELPGGIILEGSFFFTAHALDPTKPVFFRDVNYQNHFDKSYFTDVDQWSGVLAIKYSPFSTRLRPYVGVAIAYNNWVYNDHYSFDYRCEVLRTPYCPSIGYSSDSVDLGVNIGVDIKLNKKLSIGGSVLINAYNIYHNNDTIDPYAAQQREYNRRASYHGVDHLLYEHFKMEETNWIIASINAKLYF